MPYRAISLSTRDSQYKATLKRKCENFPIFSLQLMGLLFVYEQMGRIFTGEVPVIHSSIGRFDIFGELRSIKQQRILTRSIQPGLD